MKTRPHSVRLPHEDLDVLQVGSCTCGWRVGYDCASYDQAVALAEQHCADELAAELEAGP